MRRGKGEKAFVRETGHLTIDFDRDPVRAHVGEAARAGPLVVEIGDQLTDEPRLVRIRYPAVAMLHDRLREYPPPRARGDTIVDAPPAQRIPLSHSIATRVYRPEWTVA